MANNQTRDSWELPTSGQGFISAQTLNRHMPKLLRGCDGVPVATGASVDLRLGSECYVTSIGPINLSNDNPFLVIPHGAFALLTTCESLVMPVNVLAFITMKFSFKAKGLINVSGFHVDPGFQGTLSYSVYNAGPNDIIIKLHENIFTMFLSTMTEATDTPYDGEHQGQRGLLSGLVSELAGHPTNIASLQNEIRSLQIQLRVAAAVALGVAIPLAIGILGNFQ